MGKNRRDQDARTGYEMNDEDEYDNLVGSFSNAIDQAICDKLWGKPARLVGPAMITVFAACLLRSLKECPNEVRNEWIKIVIHNLKGLQSPEAQSPGGPHLG